MGNMQWGPVVQGVNQMLDAQKQKKDRAKMYQIISDAKQSGADITIDFDEQGNMKPRISYKSKSKTDNISDLIKIMGQAKKLKESGEEARTETGFERVSGMVPPRLRGAITPEIFNKVPYRTSEFLRRGKYEAPTINPVTGKLETAPNRLGNFGEDIASLFSAGQMPYKFGGQWRTRAIPKSQEPKEPTRSQEFEDDFDDARARILKGYDPQKTINELIKKQPRRFTEAHRMNLAKLGTMAKIPTLNDPLLMDILNDIGTTTGAVNYLMRSYKMNQKQAIQWLKDNAS